MANEQKDSGEETTSLPSHEEIPSNWFFLMVSALWAVFAFAFGFEAIVNFNGWVIDGRNWVGVIALIDLVGFLFTASIALILWKRKEWLPQRISETSAAAATNAYVWIGIFVLILIISALPQILRSPAPPPAAALSAPEASVPIRAPLTADQREFRIALKQFSLTCVPDLTNRVARVFNELKTKEKELSAGSPSSVALHFFIYLAFSSGLNMQYASQVQDVARIDVESINVNDLQSALQGFLYDYGFYQSAIPNLNAIVKVDLLTLDSAKMWFNADGKCHVKLQELKIWPEASIIKTVPESQMASVGQLWATPLKVNY